jgi:hypothetical protein
MNSVKLARLDPDAPPPEYRGVVVALVLGIGLGLIVLALGTRLGSAIGG